jgi:uncharacterized protein YraI
MDGMKILLKAALLLPALVVPLSALASADASTAVGAGLRAGIIAAATTSTGNRRSGARIEGCEVTTWVESDEGGPGWVLYSQSVFDLARVEVVSRGGRQGQSDEQYYIYGGGMGIVTLRAIAPYEIAQEVADFGARPEGARISSRVPDAAGGPGYYFTDTAELMVVLDGIEDAARPEGFAEGLRAYQQAFCPPA